MKLVKLADYTEDRKTLLEIIDKAREQAKSGEIDSVMILAVTPDGEYFVSWCGMDGYSGLERVGMLEMLKMEALQGELEDDDT